MPDKMRGAVLLICSSLSFILSCSNAPDKNDRWKVPPDADQLKNPLQYNPLAKEKGKVLYNQYCRSCHGEYGFGDGAAGKDLEAKPANFHEERVRKETAGALFWKLSNGNRSMPSFGSILTEQQRWQLISYIRGLPELPAARIPPVSLREEIKVEHYLTIAPQAVRILQNPVTGHLWYTTFNGDVFEIKVSRDTAVKEEKIITAADHGIPVLQGAAFAGNQLFLCGNVYDEEKKSTRGRMVRFDLDKPAHPMTVVFNTVAYGANKTIYDHGWNAMAPSPDGKFIFVNSGARTDHGEIQDNGGLFPNARDNALTSKIFRIPVTAKDLLLPDDTSKLKADGYLYAQGIRNAYDLAFDGAGRLYGVSNSADYDYPEDMFWIREHHHYGFPWIMGGLENPQQYRDWKPDAETDSFINKSSHSWRVKYYYTDSTFPPRPPGVAFSPGVQNIGPDANEYRGHSGKIQDGDQTGVTVSTFTAHSCPLGLFFDTKKQLGSEYRGDGFVLRYSLGSRSSLMRPFTSQGADLLHLRLRYDSTTDNFFAKTTRVVEGFNDPVDAVLSGNTVYVIEYGGKEGHIWKITLPAATRSKKIKKASK